MQVTAIHHRDDPILLGSPPMKPPRFHFGLPFRAASHLEQSRDCRRHRRGRRLAARRAAHDRGGAPPALRRPRQARRADRRRQQLHGPPGRRGGRRRRSVQPRRRDVGGHDALRAGRADRHRAQRLELGARSAHLAPRTRQRGITSHSKAIIEAVRPFGWKDKFPPTSALTADEAREIEAKWGKFLE